jgi:dipeptidyl-peptidase 4
VKRLFFAFTINLLVLLSAGHAQTIASPAAPKQLTIEQIFTEAGVTGRAPETIKWSPDGTKVSFVQRDEAGEHGELWYVDTATGEKKVLVSEGKLAQLAPPASHIKDEREKERVTRYSLRRLRTRAETRSFRPTANG